MVYAYKKFAESNIHRNLTFKIKAILLKRIDPRRATKLKQISENYRFRLTVNEATERIRVEVRRNSIVLYDITKFM